jgi:hypothetical protein
MEYAAANKWLFSSSGTALSRLSSKHRLIVLVVSGQYSEGTFVVSLLPHICAVPHISRCRCGIQPTWFPFTSYTHTFKPTLAISIHLLGHSPATPSTSGAKIHLSSGVNLGKSRSWPRPALSRVQSTSFLLAVTLNINTRSPRTPQAILFPHSHRTLLPRNRNVRSSVYLQRA